MGIRNRIHPPPSLLLLLLIGLLSATLPLSRAYSQDLTFLADSVRYLWPTDASRYISSTFGETRSAHFHAGLDIRTWGREGYRVFATRDGIISRAAISPYGYGKVLFLKHDDGSGSVYAHLNRFEESLMAYVDSIRLELGISEIDLDLEERSIRVRQGDLIAWTGSTGIGPPHLHFELRTPDGEPFNPLLTNLRITDTLPPVYNGLAVEHLDSLTFHVEKLETLLPSLHGSRTDFGTIRAAGPIGLSVNVHDRADNTPNRYAPYELFLSVGSDTLFYSRVDRYNLRDGTQMLIDRVYPLLRDRYGGYQRLYLVNGNGLPFYRTGSERGVLDLPEGEHEVIITATDYYGNRSEAVLQVIVENRGRAPASEIASIPAYPRLPVPDSYGTESSSPAEKPDGHPAGYKIRSVQKTLRPGKRQFLTTPDQRVWVEVPPDALFDTLHVEMTLEYGENGPVIRFTPDRIPLKSAVLLNVILPQEIFQLAGMGGADSPPPLGLFSRDLRENRNQFHGPAPPGELVRARISRLKEIHFMTDETPPWVGRPVLENNLAGKPVVHLPVRDDGSGIDWRRSAIRVNGMEGIVEFDPDKRRLTWYHPEFTPLPSNRVEVEVADRVGNRTVRTFLSVR